MAERRFFLCFVFFLAFLVFFVGNGDFARAQETLMDAPASAAPSAAPAPMPSESADPGGAVAAPTPAGTGASYTPSTLERFLALDTDTVKLTGLEVVDVLAAAAIYPDASGAITAEQAANRYLRKDRPKFDAYAAMGQNPGAYWVVLSIYNQSGPRDWSLDFGGRETGRLGRLSSIRIEDMLTRQVLAHQDVSGPASGVGRIGHFSDTGVIFNVLEGRAALLVMRVVPSAGFPAVFPMHLTSGVAAQESPFSASFWVWWACAVAVFGAGAALFVAVATGRYAFAYFSVFLGSLPVSMWIPGGLFGGDGLDFAHLTILVFGAQSIALALSSWSLAHFFKLPIGSNVVQGGILAVGAALVLVGGTVLHGQPALASGAVVAFGIAGAIIPALMLLSYRAMLAMGMILLAGGYTAAAGIQVLATLQNPPLHDGVFVNAVAYGAFVLVPVALSILMGVPLFDGGRAVVSSGGAVTDEDRDRERLQQLRLAKESFDYNNLLKVIEHERKQLAAARTRETVRAEEMRKAKDLADEANRAKSAFLAVVSHEIRTPMTGVMAMVKLLEDTTLTKTQHEYAQTIKESGNAMMALLNDILDFEKIETGKMQLEQLDFDLHRLLNAVVTLMSGHATSKGINLGLDIHFSVPAVVIGDMTRLRQVLLNLIGNAIKFTKEGGVTIKVSSTLDTDVQQREGRMFHHLYFAIEDTGIGIPVAAQKNIFTPFSQADKSIARKFGGSGLGLAISKRLIEAMGSSINIKSKEGVGTTFFFTLDLFEGDRARVVETAAPSVSMPGGRGAATEAGGRKEMASGRDQDSQGAAAPTPVRVLRIMVLEDNNITQRVLETLIEKVGHKATLVSSAEEAIAFLEMGERFDLIFSDINLTGASGLEFARIVRGMGDDTARLTPIVALSGHVDDDDVAACYEAGMNAHLAKPIDPDLFTSIIHQVELGTFVSESAAPAPVYSPRSDVAAEPVMPDVVIPEPQPARMPSDDRTAAEILGIDEPGTDETAQDDVEDDDQGPAHSAVVHAGGFETLEMDLIGTLRESLGDAQLKQLLDGLYVKAEEIIAALQSQQTIDVEFTRARSHEMKGMCGNFGLKKLSDQARQIEQSVKAGQTSDVDDLIASLMPIYQQSRAEITQWLSV